MGKKNTISKILKLRDNKKKEIEIEAKKAADKAHTEKKRLEGLEKDFTDSLDFFNINSSDGSMDINKMNTYYDFFSRINGKINKQKKVHEQCESKLKTLKTDLVEAHKDKKMMEILHDREIRKDQREKMDAEQKESDFLAISRRCK